MHWRPGLVVIGDQNSPLLRNCLEKSKVLTTNPSHSDYAGTNTLAERQLRDRHACDGRKTFHMIAKRHKVRIRQRAAHSPRGECTRAYYLAGSSNSRGWPEHHDVNYTHQSRRGPYPNCQGQDRDRSYPRRANEGPKRVSPLNGHGSL